MRRKTQCLFCKETFYPHPRTFTTNKGSCQKQSFQRACSKPACRKLRKKLADQAWRNRNPFYFKTRGSKIRRWAKAYPNYWKRYRAAHPLYTRSNRLQSAQRMRQRRLLFAKQDAIRSSPVGYLNHIQRLRPPEMFAKQDTISYQLDGILTFLMAKEMFAKPNAIDPNSPPRLHYFP